MVTWHRLAGTVGGWPGILLRAGGMLIALLLVFGYVQRVDHENERRDVERSREICKLIKISDDINRQLPAPTGPYADLIAQGRVELHAYWLALGCDRK